MLTRFVGDEQAGAAVILLAPVSKGLLHRLNANLIHGRAASSLQNVGHPPRWPSSGKVVLAESVQRPGTQLCVESNQSSVFGRSGFGMDRPTKKDRRREIR